MCSLEVDLNNVRLLLLESNWPCFEGGVIGLSWSERPKSCVPRLTCS